MPIVLGPFYNNDSGHRSLIFKFHLTTDDISRISCYTYIALYINHCYSGGDWSPMVRNTILGLCCFCFLWGLGWGPGGGDVTLFE